MQTEKSINSILAAYAYRSVTKDRKRPGARPDAAGLSSKSRYRSAKQRFKELKHVSALVFSGPASSGVEVKLVADKLVPPQIQMTELPQRRGALLLPVNQFRTQICKAFDWKSCTINTQELSFELQAAEDLAMAWNAYQSSESQRRRDVLESVMECIRSAVYSDDVELQFQAHHALWELACCLPTGASARHTAPGAGLALVEQIEKLSPLGGYMKAKGARLRRRLDGLLAP